MLKTLVLFFLIPALALSADKGKFEIEIVNACAQPKPFEPAAPEKTLEELGRQFWKTRTMDRVPFSAIFNREQARSLWLQLDSLIARRYPRPIRKVETQFIGQPQSKRWNWQIIDRLVPPKNLHETQKELNEILKPLDRVYEKILSDLNSQVRGAPYQGLQAIIIWGCETSMPYVKDRNHSHGLDASFVVNLLGNGTVFTETNESLNEGEAILFSNERHYSNPIPSAEKFFLGLAMKFDLPAP